MYLVFICIYFRSLLLYNFLDNFLSWWRKVIMTLFFSRISKSLTIFHNHSYQLKHHVSWMMKLSNDKLCDYCLWKQKNCSTIIYVMKKYPSTGPNHILFKKGEKPVICLSWKIFSKVVFKAKVFPLYLDKYFWGSSMPKAWLVICPRKTTNGL